MTPEEWDTESSDRYMLAQLGWEQLGVARKRRLYLAAVCRLFWSHMPTPQSRDAIEAAEKFVDHLMTLDELQHVHQGQLIAHSELCAPGKRVARTQRLHLSGFALNACDPIRCSLLAGWNVHVSGQCAGILREIYGNPLRPVSFDPRWRTSDVVSLAHAIYDDRAFERMPILADALMDAGCENEEIIGHCRGGGPHIRGCWVVDMILGKE